MSQSRSKLCFFNSYVHQRNWECLEEFILYSELFSPCTVSSGILCTSKCFQETSKEHSMKKWFSKFSAPITNFISKNNISLNQILPSCLSWCFYGFGEENLESMYFLAYSRHHKSWIEYILLLIINYKHEPWTIHRLKKSFKLFSCTSGVSE